MKHIVRGQTEVELTPEQLAEDFWSRGSDEQAEFFNWLGRKEKLCFQLQYVTDEGALNQNGRNAMELIGEYAKKEIG